MSKEIIEGVRKSIAERLTLDFFVRCIHLPKGVTVMDEALKEADVILSHTNIAVVEEGVQCPECGTKHWVIYPSTPK